MKVKLLKKIRKRFQIFHFPNGYLDGYGNHQDLNMFKLVDRENSDLYSEYVGLKGKIEKHYRIDTFFSTEKECVDYLKSRIVTSLRDEGFRGCKDKKILSSANKVWYNK